MNYDVGVFTRRRIISPAESYFAVPAGVTGVGFDPTQTTAHVTLSGSNLVATTISGVTTGDASRATASHSSGLYYCEFTVTNLAAGSNAMGFGIVASTFTIGSGYVGGTADSLAMYSTAGQIFTNNTPGLIVVTGGYTNGMLIPMAVNLTTHLLWFKDPGTGFWNATGGADPTNASDPNAITIPSGTFYPVVDFESGVGSICTVNFGPTYVGTKPSGYSDW